MATSSIKLPFIQNDGLARASHRIAHALRKNQDLAVMIVRVRDVERLCASHGHKQTVALLDEFYADLSGIGRENDTIERIGDREFAVLLDGLKNRGHATLAARKIERVARKTGSRHSALPDLRTNIGIALCPAQGDDPHELLRLAEIASLDGRRNRKSVCFFEEQSAQKLFDDWGLEQRLQAALESGDLELHFQPKVCLRSREIVGAEALMRWHDPEFGPISPDVFIDLAESTGQIVELTHFAIQTACRRLDDWSESLPDLRIAVNIAPSLIKDTDIIEALQSATKIWNVCADRLTLEITENALLGDREGTHNVLTKIREFGCEVSIDDFGTGYSSLAYLKMIPADELKIDRSFVMGMLNDSGDRKIVQHAISIAKSFGLSVVAEGIESEAILSELQKLGCDYAQGYYISKPLPSEEFAEFCRGYSDSLN
ncbi:MAG: GGDEF domain-containing phosphodiesterase [Gammaproteobacteria bacterium]|nr:GGDEF domain-containing phosphodiesterase [Gammaproteobacteria bacterium]